MQNRKSGEIAKAVVKGPSVSREEYNRHMKLSEKSSEETVTNSSTKLCKIIQIPATTCSTKLNS